MIALDTSVVVAAFGSWHEHHQLALEVLSERPRLTTQTAVESYSVLTRLPEPFRVDATIAAEFLRRTFTTPRLTLSARAYAALPTRLADAGVAGGAAYDGLIAFIAHDSGAELVTLDQRAISTYRRCGVAARQL